MLFRSDVLNGGEKSRFITQLEIEGIHNLKQFIVAPKTPIIKAQLITVPKTELMMSSIKSVASNGFSPSSLTNYMRNPIDFYYQKILKIKEEDSAEEIVASNTLGTVIHNTLEDLYTPLIDGYLSVEDQKSVV